MDQDTRERIIRVAEAIKSARVDGWFGVYEDDADELLRIVKEPITHDYPSSLDSLEAT